MLGGLSVIVHDPWRRWVGRRKVDIGERFCPEEVACNAKVDLDKKTTLATCVAELETGKGVEAEHRRPGPPGAEIATDQIDRIT